MPAAASADGTANASRRRIALAGGTSAAHAAGRAGGSAGMVNTGWVWMRPS
jgi:hypothetical protein